MPSYDLVCNDCGHKFSVFCSISQKDKQTCPRCSSENVSQRFTSVTIGGKASASGSGSGGNCAPSGFG